MNNLLAFFRFIRPKAHFARTLLTTRGFYRQIRKKGVKLAPKQIMVALFVSLVHGQATDFILADARRIIDQDLYLAHLENNVTYPLPPLCSGTNRRDKNTFWNFTPGRQICSICC